MISIGGPEGAAGAPPDGLFGEEGRLAGGDGPWPGPALPICKNFNGILSILCGYYYLPTPPNALFPPPPGREPPPPNPGVERPGPPPD